MGGTGIALLGPLVVNGDDGGEAVALGPRDRVVLAALAVRPGQVVSAEQLADALWGERPPASWNKVVPGCVMRLRRVLGAAAIETTPHGYRLIVPLDEIDAQRFERLVGRGRELLTLGEPERAAHTLGEALALWRGRALIELAEWEPGRTEATRLDELRRDAEEARIDACLRSGRHREVLGDAQALVAEAPLRERRWALLALAQYLAGRQGEALRTLRQARAVLASELGVDPGPELVAMEQAILRQDPALVVEAVSGRGQPDVPVPRARAL